MSIAVLDLFKKPASQEDRELYNYVLKRAEAEAKRLHRIITKLAPDKGFSVLLVGAQSSGKSLLLTELVKRLNETKELKFSCFYPEVDRPDVPKGWIYSRHGERYEALGYETKRDIEKMFHDFDVVLIDEVQFTPYELQSFLVKEAEEFVKRGGVLVMAGLLYTSLQGEFLITSVLSQKANEVLELRSTCQMCGRPNATRNQRVINGKASKPHDQDLVPPSAKVHYEPRCVDCIVR